MNTNITDAKRALFDPDNKLAFIVGNGINRYAYGDQLDVSWGKLLLDAWRANLRQTLTTIKDGITYTELYDVMELEAEPSMLRESVVNMVNGWPVQEYHKSLQAALLNLDKPVLTTNFDGNLEEGLNKVIVEPLKKVKGFTGVYPWNVVYTNKENFTVQDIYGFGVWHINGMSEYKQSLRLGLSQYTLQSKRASEFIHSAASYEDNFRSKNQEIWRGHNTWLHLIFNCDLCILGLSIDTQETFLRWLLIERAKYFKKFPQRIRHGWYVGTRGDLTPGKQFFLEKTGFEIIELSSYEEIYKGLLDVQ